jgi:hypothetical protein
MNISSEQIRTQQRTLGKGDTQRIGVSPAKKNGHEPATKIELWDPPIEPPRDPARRQEFWLDTCRGFAHIKFGCAQIQELYRRHGCRFAEPTPQQVRGILEALDTAAPRWETEHPELFYQTLELSFPELLIRR